MRLLHILGPDAFIPVEYFEDDVPRYAILSHRWGPDAHEVSYDDLITGRATSKVGWQKIVLCGKQAARDGFEYFWIDTCCIDKKSSAELTEAINSMWLWYKNSGICYAYLADVTKDGDQEACHKSMAESQWFFRGWTLQELIAPANVVFFDHEWQEIGTRSGLSSKIAEITGIDDRYLCDNAASPHSASVAQRMSWASRRKTKRKEDIAYSLLGLFRVNMPMVYGEGMRAFERLQEEIVRQSDDLSIFAWEQSDTESQDYQGYLAPSPAGFASCGKIVRSANSAPGKPLVIANHRLYLEVPLLMRETHLYARLNCRYEDDFFCDLGMQVSRWGKLEDLNDRGYRRQGKLRRIPVLGWETAGTYPIAVTAEPVGDPDRHDPSHNAFVFQHLPDGYSVSEVFPVEAWEAQSHAVSTDEILLRSTSKSTCNHRLVLLSNRHDHHLLIMLWHHRVSVFRDWTAEAAVLPKEDASDMMKAYNHWKANIDSKLKTSLLVDGRRMRVEVTPQKVRGERFSVVDFIIEPASATLGAVRHDVLWACKKIGYRIRSIAYLFKEPQRFVEPWLDNTWFDQTRVILWQPLLVLPTLLAQWIEYERYKVLPSVWNLPFLFLLFGVKRIGEVQFMRYTTWQEQGRPDLVIAYSSRGNDAFDWDLVCFLGVCVIFPGLSVYVYVNWDLLFPSTAANIFYVVGGVVWLSISRQQFISEYPESSKILPI